MDGDFALIMGMVVAVTGMSLLGANAIVRQVLDYKREKKGIGPNAASSPQITEIADRTDLIEDRVRVLERLAIDKGQLLSDEIEALRKDLPALGQKEPS